ncbi:MAG: hypothetical protein ABI200_04855 [Gaiellales bacterium]
MQVRSVSWPVLGDRATFRRTVTQYASLGSLAIAATVLIAAIANPGLLVPLLPLAGSAILLLMMWTHGAARTAARRRELEQSFAGLMVIHHGEAYKVEQDAPVIGAYATRRHAAHAALDRGGWAIIVQAWDRCYLLAAQPAHDAAREAAPVSFRSRAVADVIPALLDDAAAVSA